MRSTRRVGVVGPFPPPVHGAAEVTRRIAEALEGRAAVERLSNAPDAGATGLRYHLSRARRVLAAARAIAARPGPVYLSAAGGRGLGYDVLLAAAARSFARPLFIHHHSFAYIDRRSALAALLVRAAGSRAVHVCLCARMADGLAARYGRVRTMIVSNAAFQPPVAESPPHPDRPLRLGHFGNLSREKGLDLVLATASALTARDVPYELVLAGPVADRSASGLLAEGRARLGAHLVELGPLYGADKERFFSAADVFLFPSRYANEAEPLVVFEALAHGLPVVAVARGCIPEQVGNAGVLARSEAAFIETACEAIAAWHADRESLDIVCGSARARMRRLHATASAVLEDLRARLANAAADMPEGVR